MSEEKSANSQEEHENLQENSTSNIPFNSTFIVKPRCFKECDNFHNITKKEEDNKEFYNNLFAKTNIPEETNQDQSGTQQVQINENDQPIQNPTLSETDSKLMKLGFSCNNTNDFYKGIFNYQKSKFKKPLTDAGFVILFADTKKSMIDHTDYLIDCKKETNWFSTKKIRPSITFYFPFHLISITGIGFRTHSNQKFGSFLRDFSVYGIDDDKNVICLGCFETYRLCDYEVKYIFKISSPKPLRAIHIRNNLTKFGVNMIEIYGTGTYNEIQEGFSKRFLTHQDTYLYVDDRNKVCDRKDPHKSFKKRIMSKFKKNDDDDLGDSSDDESKDKRLFIKRRFIEAFDAIGPSIIKQYGYPELKDEKFSPVIVDSQKRLQPLTCIPIFFTDLKMILTGIKITFVHYEMRSDDAPYGLNFYGHLHHEGSEHEEWRHIFSSKEEPIFPRSVYYYPIKNANEFTDFAILSYGKKFIIHKIDFYGQAKTIEPIEFPLDELKKYEIAFEQPPVGSFLDTKKADIFQTMKYYYGSMLTGFVNITTEYEYRDIHFYKTFVGVKDPAHPYIYFEFVQHKLQLTTVKLIYNGNKNCLNHFYIVSGRKILAEGNRPKSQKEYIVQIDEPEYINNFLIYNIDGSFNPVFVEIYGNLVKGDSYHYAHSGYRIDCVEFIKGIMMKNEKKESVQFVKEFDKELMIGVEPNPQIVFSMKDQSSRDDIISYGLNNINDFISFYNYGNNGNSLLHGDKNNIWLTTTNGNENSFKIVFKHHSVRLTKFSFQTPNDPRFEKYMPSIFYLYRYNSRAKHWDVILTHENRKPLDIMSHYTFDINEKNQKIFYRIIKFITFSGQVALAYVELFGDVIEETDEAPIDVAQSGMSIIKYKNCPIIEALKTKGYSDGLFKKAMKIFGPELNGFVLVNDSSPAHVCSLDIWEARNHYYESVDKDNVIIISFYFPYHEVVVRGYQIKPYFDGSVDYWCVIGCLSVNDEGVVLSLCEDKKLKDDNSYYSFETYSKHYNTPFRVLRFVGLNGKFLFSSLDFYGIAKPTKSGIITDNDVKQKFHIPSEVIGWYNG